MANADQLFAAIPHLVIDSPAFADLSGEAVRVLMIIARQYDGRNNGLLQATFSYCNERGVGSNHTVRSAIAALIAHGFIYRTRSHGFEAGKNTWCRYALTWQPLCDKEKRKGLFLDGFVSRAWQKWPFDKKSEGQKLHHLLGKNCTFIEANDAENALNRELKTAPYE